MTKPTLVMNASGNLINPFELRDSDFDPQVIAQTLSRTCRFWGQTKRFYSVAQHCLVMCLVFEGNQELQKWALLHEVFEGLTGMDVPTPIKSSPHMQAYRDAEEKALLQAARLFGLTPPLPREIKEADKRLMVSEALVLMNTTNYDWCSIAKPYGDDILTAIRAESMNSNMDEIEARFLTQWGALFEGGAQ